MNFTKIFRSICLIVVIMIFPSCSYFQTAQKSLNIKNLNFDYMTTVDKIIIQSTRDPGFRFSVTNKPTITSLYDILSTAKLSENKNSLNPDYIFEMYEGDKLINKYNYVAGVEDSKSGNFYNDSEIFSVSLRIDNEIIRNLSNIRKPQDFENIYYSSILSVLKMYIENPQNEKNLNSLDLIGINLNGDIDMLKYMLSIDINKFEYELQKLSTKFKIIDSQKDTSDYNLNVDINTIGYKTEVYKSSITFDNNKTKNIYYVYGKYENGDWNIRISDNKDTLPGF